MQRMLFILVASIAFGCAPERDVGTFNGVLTEQMPNSGFQVAPAVTITTSKTSSGYMIDLGIGCTVAATRTGTTSNSSILGVAAGQTCDLFADRYTAQPNGFLEVTTAAHPSIVADSAHLQLTFINDRTTDPLTMTFDGARADAGY